MDGFQLWHRGLGIVLLMGMGLPEVASFELARFHPDTLGWSIYDLATLLNHHLGIPERDTLTVVTSLYVTLCVALIVGWQVRIAALGLLVLHYRIYVAVPLFSYGFDFIALSALAYCAAFSRRWGPTVIRTMQVHLCIIYFFSGLDKIIGPTWRNGEAAWKAAQQSFEQPIIPVGALEALPWLWVAAGWSVVLLELSYPVLIWWRPTRRWALAGALMLHVAIVMVMGLYAFSALMILLNLVAFYFKFPTQPSHPSDQAIRKDGDVLLSQTEICTTNKTSFQNASVKPSKPP